MEHIVDYKKYCPLCEYAGTDENEEPCDECLSYPINTDTRAPTRFKKKDEQQTKKGPMHREQVRSVSR